MPLEQELKLALSAGEAARLAELLGPPVSTTLQHNYYLDTPEEHLCNEHYGLRLRVEYAPPGPDGTQRRPHDASTGDLPGAGLPPGAQHFLLTLKGPSSPVGDFVSRTEDEVRLERADAERILREGLDPASADLAALSAIAGRLGLGRVVCLGSVTNERRVLRLQPAGQQPPLLLQLDRTSFPDGSVDHEMEFELVSPDAQPARPRPSPDPAALAATTVALRELRAFFAAAGLPYRVRRRGKFTRFLERRRRARPGP
jgi:uncharacterized protein YjbK